MNISWYKRAHQLLSKSPFLHDFQKVTIIATTISSPAARRRTFALINSFIAVFILVGQLTLTVFCSSPNYPQPSISMYSCYIFSELAHPIFLPQCRSCMWTIMRKKCIVFVVCFLSSIDCHAFSTGYTVSVIYFQVLSLYCEWVFISQKQNTTM